MRFALMAGVLVALLCAVAGTFVVLRGLAFIGDALAHGVLPGVAGALLLGAPGMLGAAVGSAVMIAGVSFIMRRSGLSSDTAIGLLFVAMLALGVIMVSRSDSFNGDIVRILFGEILGIRMRNIVVLAMATVIVSAATALFYRPFLLLCFDPEQADVSGFNSRRFHTIMLIIVATTVVVSFQAVGTLLVFGMLVAPAGAGALLAQRIGSMIAWAMGIGSLSVYIGLLLSYHFDLSAGATVVFVTVCAFFVVLSVQIVRKRFGKSVPSATELHATEQHATELHAIDPAASIGKTKSLDSNIRLGMGDGNRAQTYAIEAEELVVGYGAERVVEHLNVVLRAGETLALVGTNGSGKSTFLKTLLGLIPDLGGTLTVMGGSPGAKPKHVAYLGQAHLTRFQVPIRAIDVVRMGRFASLGLMGRQSNHDRRLVDEAMTQMGVDQLANQPLGSLSGGQQQRVYLAQVMAHDADVLILDEPTAGLDAAGHQRYEALITHARERGAAVITATHDIAEAATCDQVLLLNRRVIAHGIPSEVLTATRLLETFGIMLQGIDHGDHQDFVMSEDPHGHDGHAGAGHDYGGQSQGGNKHNPYKHRRP